MSYSKKLTDQLYWWLGRKRPFIINDEYKLELLYIDKINNSVKILVTNMKTGDRNILGESPKEDNDGQE